MKLTQLSFKQRMGLFAGVVAVTLFVGLYPKGYEFKNHVESTADGNALEFGKYGVAFTDPVIDSKLADILNDDGFEISLALGPEIEKQEGFAIIAQIHSGDVRNQLLIARWSDFLIVMNGDDYRHRLRQPRISARLSQEQRKKGVEILIRSGSDGSVIELKDHLVVRRSNVVLKIPSTPNMARIVFGNSISRQHSWLGQIKRFGIRMADGETDPVISFDMSQAMDSEVPNSGLIGGVLGFPTSNLAIERQLLEWPINHQFEMNQSFISDFLLNLLGFAPFGFCLAMCFGMAGGNRTVIVVLVAAAVTSLLIEFAQTWMPSRSSSSLDLILNIAGGGLGLLVWHRLARFDGQKKGRPTQRLTGYK